MGALLRPAYRHHQLSLRKRNQNRQPASKGRKRGNDADDAKDADPKKKRIRNVESQKVVAKIRQLKNKMMSTQAASTDLRKVIVSDTKWAWANNEPTMHPLKQATGLNIGPWS